MNAHISEKDNLRIMIGKYKGTYNDDNKKEDIVTLINQLSKYIKEYYKISKNEIREMNMALISLSNQFAYSKSIINEIGGIYSDTKINSVIDMFDTFSHSKQELYSSINSINDKLIDFFNNSKAIFLQIKNSKKKTKEGNLSISQTISVDPYLLLKPSPKMSNKRQKEQNLYLNKTDCNTPPDNGVIEAGTKNNYEKYYFKANTQLAKYILVFINDIDTIQESSINLNFENKEKKILFEKSKNTLREMSEKILDNVALSEIDPCLIQNINDANSQFNQLINLKHKYEKLKKINVNYQAIIEKQEYDFTQLEKELGKVAKDTIKSKTIETALQISKIELEEQKSLNILQSKVEQSKLLQEIDYLKDELNTKDKESTIYAEQMTELKKQLDTLINKRLEENTAINSLKNNIDILHEKSINDDNSIDYYKSMIAQIESEKNELIFQKDSLIKENRGLLQTIKESNALKDKEINDLLQEISKIKGIDNTTIKTTNTKTNRNSNDNRSKGRSNEKEYNTIEALKQDNDQLLKKVIEMEGVLLDREEYINQRMYANNNKINLFNKFKTISVDSLEYSNNDNIINNNNNNRLNKQTIQMMTISPRIHSNEEREVNELSNQVSSRIISLQKEMDKLKEENNDICKSQNELTIALEKTKENGTIIEAENKTLREQIVEYQTQITNLKRQLDSEQALSKELSESFVIQLEMNKVNKQEVINLKEETHNIKQDNALIHSSISKLNEDYSRAKDYISHLEKEKSLLMIRERDLIESLNNERELLTRRIRKDSKTSKDNQSHLYSSRCFQLDSLDSNRFFPQKKELIQGIKQIDIGNCIECDDNGNYSSNRDYRHLFNEKDTSRNELKDIEEENEITPEKYTIVLEAEYSNLKWLLLRKSIRDNEDNDGLNLYSQFRWVPSTKLSHIERYNSYIEGDKDRDRNKLLYQLENLKLELNEKEKQIILLLATINEKCDKEIKANRLELIGKTNNNKDVNKRKKK